MEMNKNNPNTYVGGVKNVAAKSKSMTPAVLGMPNSHGVKFPTNMSSEYKKELFSKLEEWRKVRKEKLAASILAKQKQVLSSAPIKSKTILIGDDGIFKKQPGSQDRQSVFERLYRNSGKMKKPEAFDNGAKQKQIPKVDYKKSAFLLTDDLINLKQKSLLAAKESENFSVITDSDSVTKKENETLSHKEFFVQNGCIDSFNHGVKTEEMKNENFSEITVEESLKNSADTTKLHPHSNQGQMKSTVESAIKTDSELRGSLVKAFETGKQKHILRRSISMKFHQKKKVENAIRKCVSAKNLYEIHSSSEFKAVRKGNNKNPKTLNVLNCHNDKRVKKEALGESMGFVTSKSTKSLTSTHLRSKLEDWLKVNGHSLDGYRHLRCFGVFNSGNIPEPSAIPMEDSSEKSCASDPNVPAIEQNKENVSLVVQQVDVNDAENWLKELHRLIVELKYPPERCEEWLTAISKKCLSCSQLPIYWECLAALHESKGDLKSAIEDYERAIIKGGEVDAVGDSLAQLFDKMVIEQKKHSKPKLEKGLDPKNIFKSTIIKFALQQKAIKKLDSELEPGVREQLYVATPVRRSSRIRTPFKSTDEVASLQSLTPELRKNVTFKPNESLLQ